MERWEDLETFLRGMETKIATVARTATVPLKPSLEGWKPWEAFADIGGGGP